MRRRGECASALWVGALVVVAASVPGVAAGQSLKGSPSAVAHAYLSLDQSMSFIALVNHLRDGSIQKRFAADPSVAPALPMLAAENFFDRTPAPRWAEAPQPDASTTRAAVLDGERIRR